MGQSFTRSQTKTKGGERIKKIVPQAKILGKSGTKHVGNFTVRFEEVTTVNGG